MGFQRFGSEEALARDPIGHLYEVYVKINEAIKGDVLIEEAARSYFKAMEDGTTSLLSPPRFHRTLLILAR